jgi:ELWxxDGT repeat protein/cysteine-rich repeat protein
MNRERVLRAKGLSVAVLVAGAILARPARVEGQTAFLVKDVAAGPASSYPSSMVHVNGTLYFAATDETGDRELWKSDGSAGGTARVRDIDPNDSSRPGGLVAARGGVFLSAETGAIGRELWKTDGTEAGTVLVKDIDPRPGQGSEPGFLTDVNGTVFFVASDETHGRELWKSDGSPAGTMLVKDVVPGPSGSFPFPFANLNGTLLFRASVPGGKMEVWASDGTDPGTVPLGTFDSVVSAARFGNVAVFGARSGFSIALWKSDGTTQATVPIKTLPGSISELVVAAGTIFFVVGDPTLGDVLWTSDGTEAGTVPVEVLGSGAEVRNLFAANSRVFFAAADEMHGREPWTSDGTAGGTGRVRDIFPGIGGSDPYFLASTEGTVLFEADDGVHGNEIWRSNGSAAGTALVADILPGGGRGVDSFRLELGGAPPSVDGTTYVVATDGVLGYELWALTRCGDGVLDAGEACDDGNRTNGDCCSTTCDPAPAGTACAENLCLVGGTCDGGGVCTGSAPRTCDDGDPCNVDTCDPLTGCGAGPLTVPVFRGLLLDGLAVDGCAGEHVPGKIRKLYGAAGRQIARAEKKKSRRQRHLIRQAVRRLKRGERRAHRARRLDDACQAGLVARFADTRAQAMCLLGK